MRDQERSQETSTSTLPKKDKKDTPPPRHETTSLYSHPSMSSTKPLSAPTKERKIRIDEDVPKNLLPAGMKQIDTPNDHNCLFWSAALGLLVPLLGENDADKTRFNDMYARLFGTSGTVTLKDGTTYVENWCRINQRRHSSSAQNL